VRTITSAVKTEATGTYWKSVWHVLEEDFTLVLGNAGHIRNVPGRKSDVKDAEWIADLLAHSLIRGSFVPPAPIQEVRDLTRTRKQLVREIAQHTQRILTSWRNERSPNWMRCEVIGDAPDLSAFLRCECQWWAWMLAFRT
jgi:transposase